jgi:hypothetical protein
MLNYQQRLRLKLKSKPSTLPPRRVTPGSLVIASNCSSKVVAGNTHKVAYCPTSRLCHSDNKDTEHKPSQELAFHVSFPVHPKLELYRSTCRCRALAERHDPTVEKSCPIRIIKERLVWGTIHTGNVTTKIFLVIRGVTLLFQFGNLYHPIQEPFLFLPSIHPTIYIHSIPFVSFMFRLGFFRDKFESSRHQRFN